MNNEHIDPLYNFPGQKKAPINANQRNLKLKSLLLWGPRQRANISSFAEALHESKVSAGILMCRKLL